MFGRYGGGALIGRVVSPKIFASSTAPAPKSADRSINSSGTPWPDAGASSTRAYGATSPSRGGGVGATPYLPRWGGRREAPGGV